MLKKDTIGILIFPFSPQAPLRVCEWEEKTMALMAAVAGKMLTKYQNADNPVEEMRRAER